MILAGTILKYLQKKWRSSSKTHLFQEKLNGLHQRLKNDLEWKQKKLKSLFLENNYPIYMDYIFDLQIYVAEKSDSLSKSLERSTRSIVTNARQRKPLLFEQTLRSRLTTSL